MVKNKYCIPEFFIVKGCIWHWVIKNNITAGAELSISWYRRNEKNIREIGRELIKSLGKIVSER